MKWVPIFKFRLFVKLGGVEFAKGIFSRNKTFALNTSLKKRICPIEIVKIDIWMIVSYVFNYCCHITSLFYLIYTISMFFYIFVYIFELRPREARPETSSISIYNQDPGRPGPEVDGAPCCGCTSILRIPGT